MKVYYQIIEFSRDLDSFEFIGDRFKSFRLARESLINQFNENMQTNNIKRFGMVCILSDNINDVSLSLVPFGMNPSCPF